MREHVLAAIRELGTGGLRPPVTPPRALMEALALEVFAWQRARSPVLEALAEGRVPGCLAEIPAVPVDLFKQLPVGTFPADEARVVFRTSGTTQGTRGVVRLLGTEIYDAGARAWFSACVPDVPRVWLSLCSHAADSSLGHMVDDFARAWGSVSGAQPLFDAERGVVPDAWARLAAAAASRQPLFLACTAFALDALFAMPGAVSLDPRSVVMVTGGFKGRAVRLDAPSLYAALAARLGAPRVVGEYGMTELSSQLWTAPVAGGDVPGAFRAPPWLHAYTVDPVRGAPCAGEGQLRFVDLCNVDTAIAIETLDLGTVAWVDGVQEVTLRGRIAGAEARGCSLTAEDFLARP